MTEICFCVIKFFGNIPNRILKKDEVLRGMLELGYTYLSNLWLKLQTVKKNTVDTHCSACSDITGHFLVPKSWLIKTSN
jgi:hypothetical protein